MGKLLFLPVKSSHVEDEKKENSPSFSVSQEQAFAALMFTSQNVILRQIRELHMRDITFELIARGLNLSPGLSGYLCYEQAFTTLIKIGVLHKNGEGNYHLDDVLAEAWQNLGAADRDLYGALRDGVFSQKFSLNAVTYCHAQLVAREAGLEDDGQVIRSFFTLIHSGFLQSVEGENGVYRLTRF